MILHVPGINSGKTIGGGNSNIFCFHPYLGKTSNVANIFQGAWKHQLEKLEMMNLRKEDLCHFCKWYEEHS